MAEPITEEQPPPPAPDPNSTFPPPSDFDSISIPPFDDHFYHSGSDHTPIGELMSDLGFPDGEFELTFDGMDDLYFPAENESFLIPVNTSNQEQFGDFTPESEGSGISGDCLVLPKDAVKSITTSGCINQDSDDRCSGAERSLDLPTPLSSQGSGNCGSDVSEATNESSPKSRNVVVDQKVKVEEAATTTTSITKRKKEIDEDLTDESRNSKYRRSGEDADASAVTGEEDEKKKARLMRNRESAQLSRQRKKHYVEELEEKVRNMHSTITDLNGKISYFMAENATLRQQLGGNGMCPPHLPPPPMGMYPPMAPMPYPWMPCPPYMVKQQGSQVPLIPIPRLKPQNTLGTSKAKKSESKKSEAKTKKVASISFLGLLFCLFLFGALAPIVNVNYGGISGAFYGNYRSNYITDQIYSQHRDRVLDTSRSGAGTGVSNSNGMHCGRDSDRGARKNISATESSVPPGNGSEPLVASLFVPRNDKLVKIDGNLIINSILASEKAVASRKASESKERKADLVISKDYSPALPLPDVGKTEEMAKHLYRSKTEKQKALSSGSADTLKDQFKTKAANGEMQQWFREGVAGPMFSSGMCTEVFQFDVSSTSGAIIPASPATNVSAEHGKNTTDTHKQKNRRILRGLPIPLPGSDFNLTKEHQRNSSSKEIKPASSMVVSVLVDPREGGDGDIDGMIGGPKSLSRVFVVVLLDSAKYVTYSCVLPRSGAPHLVTT
ncbi:Basic-leucine zipper domain [Arabidopsis suecica]|uniref:Basic-leucine zipper domain n=1 Tax=Arabidopsis suecica TaxID=45249 RepID=A0A8T2ALY8_ARASU|nr:Basic-leucine zipper domain [Arabidopsis suecica]